MAVIKQRIEFFAMAKNNNDEERLNTSKRLQILMVISNFCRETSVHGLGQVVKHSVAIAKLVWLVVFFAAVIGNAYHISTLVVMYLDYPVQEVTKSQHDPIAFPDVTICNQNPISRSNYERVLRNKSSDLSQYLDRIKGMFEAGALTEKEEGQYNTVTAIQVNIGQEEAMTIGHQIKDLVLRCRFRGKACNITERFKLIMNAVLYNCYTFNPDAEGDSFFATGPENGLSLILYLEANNGTEIHAKYDAKLNSANALGAKVILHPRNVYPIPHIDGMDIMPGHSTSIAFKVTRTRRLPRPHGDCTSNRSLNGLAGYEYSTTGCLNVCIQRRFVNICGCKSIYQPVLDCEQHDSYCGKLSENEDIYKVLEKAKRERKCVTNVWAEFVNRRDIRDGCGCKPRCVEEFYTYTVSESLWPAPKYHESFIERELLDREDRLELKAFTQMGIPSEYARNETHNHSNYQLVTENFARLNIYLRDQESILREQQIAYPLSKLFSDIGGTLGLWVGLSLLTLIELLQLGARLLMVLCGKRVE